LAVLTGAGAVYQAIATVRDQRRYPPPGNLVDIGGYRLHVHGTGEGRPTVVMEAGAADWSLFWSWVQPEVETFTRVCTYDRAGLGWSDPGPQPRTGQHMVRELHALLRTAGIEGPYVLVGHSAGGYIVRLYASRFPDEVVGMVLVDVTHEDGTSFISPEKYQRLLRQYHLARLTAPLGLVRLIGTLHLSSEFETWLNKFPPEVQAMNRAIYYRSRTWQTGWSERISDEETVAQLRAAGSLGDRPLVVLTALADHDDEKLKQEWMQQHAHLAARLSSSSTHIIAEKSGHFIQLDQPDLVITAIRQVVEAVRSRR
jgi:pimeloyl-ACP methyl ester carboxylesterase